MNISNFKASIIFLSDSSTEHTIFSMLQITLLALKHLLSLFVQIPAFSIKFLTVLP